MPSKTHLSVVNFRLSFLSFFTLFFFGLQGQGSRPVLPVASGYSIQLASARNASLLEECVQELRNKPFLTGYCGEVYLKKNGDVFGARLRIIDERSGSRVNVLDVNTIRNAMLDNVVNQTRYKRALVVREDADLLVPNYAAVGCGTERTRPAVEAPAAYDNSASSLPNRTPFYTAYSIQLASLDQAPDRSDFPAFADKILYYPAVGKGYRVRLGFFGSKKEADDFLRREKALQKYAGAFSMREERGMEIRPVAPGPSGLAARSAAPQAYEAASRMVSSRYGIQLASLKQAPDPDKFSRLSDQNVYYRLEKGVYKVRVGFYDKRSEADYNLENYVKPRGYPKAYVVEEEAGARMVMLFQPAANVSPDAYFEPEAQAYLYTVKKGDTLFGIAQRHNLNVEALCRLNGITQRAGIRPGQRLRVR